MLNVLVKQLELVALLTYFNAEQVSHREHSYPAFSIDNGEMSTANQLHSFEGLVGCFIALNHRAQLARHVADDRQLRFGMVEDDVAGRVASLPSSSITQTAPMFFLAMNSAASCTVAEALAE